MFAAPPVSPLLFAGQRLHIVTRDEILESEDLCRILPARQENGEGTFGISKSAVIWSADSSTYSTSVPSSNSCPVPVVVCTHAHTRTYAHTRAHAYTIHTYTHAQKYTHTHTKTHARMHTPTHTHTYLCIHAHIHTHTCLICDTDIALKWSCIKYK